MNLTQRASRVVGMVRRRVTRTPFLGHRRLIVHASHHKVGTVWFMRVLSTLSTRYGLRFFVGRQEDMPMWCDVFLQAHSRLDLDRLPAFVGSHMIRDPRDMIVSGYFYHRRTTEKWVQVPKERYGGRSLQEHLNSISQHDGLLVEIERFARGTALRDMLAWDYGHPNVFEIRYENIIANEESVFRNLFRHYGFHERAIDEAIEVTKQFTLARQKARAGHGKGHVRSGRPGEWREVFESVHVSKAKELLGPALIHLGYESDYEW